MNITSFEDMYTAELQELANAEGQFGEVLQKMADTASSPALKDALVHHKQETGTQKQRLEKMLKKHGTSSRAHVDQSMQALVKETEKMLAMVKGSALRDAGLIASAQKLKHYEIAAYGTAAALAEQLNLREEQDELHKTLEEEKKADATLTQLAKSGINRAAMAA